MWLTRLTLSNFRNYTDLDLELPPGLVIVAGGNARGKTNLLEALYILSIAKSFRATNEREVISWQATRELAAASVGGVVQRQGDRLRVHVGFHPIPAEGPSAQGAPAVLVRKRIHVNSVLHTAAAAVGRFNAVIFSAADLDLVLGSPALRRRYLDILICQFDREYLRALQRYQRVLAERNHLLRMAREGRARLEDELPFWDEELVMAGARVTQGRARVMTHLAAVAVETHKELGDGEKIAVRYAPSVSTEGECQSREQVAASFRQALASLRPRELAQGMSLVGPHRDDVLVLVEGMAAGIYSSRGQARTVALALRLAEAEVLARERGDGPVLLLDDVLSELDASRRRRVLEKASHYDQAVVTTTELGLVDASFLTRATCYTIEGGQVVPVGVL